MTDISVWVDDNLTMIRFIAIILVLTFIALALRVSWKWGKKSGNIEGEIRGVISGFNNGCGLPKAVQTMGQGKSYQIKEFFSSKIGTSDTIENYAVVFNAIPSPLLIQFTTKREIPKEAKYLNCDKDGWYFSSTPSLEERETEFVG